MALSKAAGGGVPAGLTPLQIRIAARKVQKDTDDAALAEACSTYTSFLEAVGWDARLLRYTAANAKATKGNVVQGVHLLGLMAYVLADNGTTSDIAHVKYDGDFTRTAIVYLKDVERVEAPKDDVVARIAQTTHRLYGNAVRNKREGRHLPAEEREKKPDARSLSDRRRRRGKPPVSALAGGAGAAIKQEPDDGEPQLQEAEPGKRDEIQISSDADAPPAAAAGRRGGAAAGREWVDAD
eukprot:gene18328-3143_t